MSCKCHPDSPFLWRKNPKPSIFMKDHVFRSKGDSGLSLSQNATAVVEANRRQGKMSGTVKNFSSTTFEKEQAVIAYKQFGIYSRAKSSVKPQANKHEVPKGKL